MAKWIVTSAWPYAHGVPHLGNLIGSLLSADIFARYLRIRGHDVIFVSGSDEHGTPIEVKALQEGVNPEELSSKVHEEIVKIIRGFNIEIDNYTRTHNPVHIKFTQDFYMKIYENGYIFKQEEDVLYCEKDNIYLPDRFVIGTCPYCGYDSARGDQCESCGALLTPLQLKSPKCVICGSKPVIRTTVHYYFDLPAFTEKLIEFIEKSTTLSENAKNFSLNMLRQGLKARSITRNNKWGIPAPFPEAKDLTIYVWFEAVLGYISAVVEYFEKRGEREKWKEWWFNKETNVAFFIGKDNIPFHTIIFPALLMATKDPYTLRFYVGATEFLMHEGQKFSKSKGIGIWCDEALKLLPADYWRYTLTLIRPETKDTSFSWKTLEYAVNEELNNHLGNLVHRVLTFTKRHFNGKIPRIVKLSEDEKRIINHIFEVKRKVEKFYDEMRFQRVISEVMGLIKAANALMNKEEPWKTVKSDKDKAGTTICVLANVVKSAAIMLYPIIPESSLKILRYLGIRDKVEWRQIDEIIEDIKIDLDFSIVFNKINVDELKEKLAKLREATQLISMEEFEKIKLGIGKIVEVREVAEKENIYFLKIKVGDKIYGSIAGLKQSYKPDELIGKKVVVVLNLRPKKIAGYTSEVMILAAKKDDKLSLLTVDRDIEEGAEVY